MLVAAGCGTPTTESVIGNYEYELFGTHKVVFLQNGVGEELPPRGDKKEFKWAIESGRLLMTYENGFKGILKKKWNGDLTVITGTRDGKLEELSKEDQLTLKKIK